MIAGNLGPIGCRFNRCDEEGLEAALFEFMHSENGRTTRGLNGFLEDGGMNAGFDDHFGSTEKGISREFDRQISWKSHLDSSIREALNHGEHLKLEHIFIVEVISVIQKAENNEGYQILT